MKTIVLIFSFILLATTHAYALPADTIGQVQTLKGTATIQRASITIPAAISLPVYRGDTIRTSKTGSIGIVLSDETTLSLGPNSEIVIKDYMFNPKEGKFSMITRMVKGTFSYISGMIGKLSPEYIRMELPEATIAVRGTKLLITIEE